MIKLKTLLTALNAKYIHSSLAIRSISAYCALYGKKAETAEFTINNSKELIIREIFKIRPDVIGFSCYIWNIDMILEISSSIKKILPHTFIFLGGPEVSFSGDDILKNNSFIDLIIKGEGEKTVLSLLNRIEDREKNFCGIPGITFRYKGQIMSSPPAEPMDLNHIPFPYNNIEEMENRIIYYESQRGCPYNCGFCLSSIDGKPRFLSNDRIKADLDFFIKNNVKQVKFVDRTFNCNKGHARFIWEYIMRNDNGKTNFHMEIEAHALNDDDIDFLKNARKGLFQFEIGVQSTNTKTLGAVSRNADFETIKRKVNKIKAAKNIHVHLDLIAGLPFEDYASFKKSFNDVYSLRPEQLQLGFLKLLKGSALRRDAQKHGIVYNEKAPYEVLFTREMPFEDMLRLKAIEEMVETYYNSFKIITAEKFISSMFPSAFDFYEALGEYWVSNGFHAVNHSKNQLYEVLFNFCIQSGLTAENQSIAEQLMRFDLLLSDNIKTLPAFMKEDNSEEFKAIKREFFNSAQNREKYLPDFSGFTSSQLSRMCRVEPFHIDVKEFAESGRIINKKTYILYNYQSRDIITNHAQSVKIDI